MERYPQFLDLPKDTYVIGVTGHMNLLNPDEIKVQVRNIFNKIKAMDHPGLVLLCPGAAGADQLVAEIAMEAEINIPVLALRLVDYNWNAELLSEFKKNEEWLKLNRNNQKITNLYIDDGYYRQELEKANKNINEENRKQALKALSHHMVAKLSAVVAAESDYIIAVWDGVDNGKRGGTSETVHIALHGKDFAGEPVTFAPSKNGILNLHDKKTLAQKYKCPKGYLFQVVTPRKDNPFPIGRFPAELIDNLPNAGKLETGFSIFPITPYEGNWLLRFKKKQIGSVYDASLIWSYYFPALLALVTVIFGSWGFREKNLNNSSENWWAIGNDIFSAINLITLDSSKDLPIDKFIWQLEIARISGLFFILFAFFIAIYLAIGNNNKIKLKPFIWSLLNKPYHLIIGLNDKSYHLAIDLIKNNRKVIILTGQNDDNKIFEMQKQGLNVFIGGAYSAISLSKIRAHRAKKVYILDDDDTVNILSLNELDQLSATAREKKKDKKFNKQTRYIHITDFRYKDFICISHPESDYSETQVFNLYENTARRISRKYPIHRFNLTKENQTAEVFVFGFGEMAEEIVMNHLRSGFYDKNRKLKITVMTSNHVDKQDVFYKKYPALWYGKEKNLAYEHTHISKIRKEIFPEGTITFKELPMSDGAYFSDETLNQAIRSGNIITLYFCTPLSVQSAAYLQAILPKISQLQRSPDSEEIITDVQCFCHYNHTEQNEVTYTEHAVNSRIPNSAVIFFGSFINECTEKCFDHLTEDKLPKLINHWYNLDNSKNEFGARKSSSELLIERLEFWETRALKENYRDEKLFGEAKLAWKSLSPISKESNLHAAEHIWTKLYLLGTSFAKIRKKLEDSSLSETAKCFIYSPCNNSADEIMALARVEHKRWCAERLLEGFLCFHDIYPDLVTPEILPSTIARWNNKNKLFKNYYQYQKQHLDLVSFDDLFTGKIDSNDVKDEDVEQIYYDEKIKDISQIEAIPYLLSEAYYKASLNF